MNDPYVYKNTSILINNLNIKNQEKLDKAESDYVFIETDNLKHINFELNSIKDALLIHKKLFSTLYKWAGNIRTLDIYKKEPILDGKSVDYVFATYINTALEDLDKEYKKIKWNELNSEDKINKICYFVSEFWHIHPFREGNTRTTAMLLYFLIKKAGLHINIDFLSKNCQYFRNALVLSCLYSQSQPQYLFDVISDCVTLKNINKNKYETINGVEVKKYGYSHHTIEKIKTIKKIEDWNAVKTK